MYFNTTEIEDLRTGLSKIAPKFEALRQRLFMHDFRTDAAREHAAHGLVRRLGDMTRCVERTFQLLPPDLADIPERTTTLDATINIQAFVMNAFGCCENIAWIWVNEREIKSPDGRPLRPAQVGLGPDYTLVRDSLTPSFRSYLDSRADWFAHLKDFRDALAHRIPLYIPPFTIDPADVDRYQQIEAEKTLALTSRDLESYERLKAEQVSLTRFQPVMTHSLDQGAKVVVFHVQLLSDFVTIEEIGEVVLDELAMSPA